MILELEFEDFRKRAVAFGTQKYYWELSDRIEVIMTEGNFIIRTTLFDLSENIRLNFLEDAIEIKGYYNNINEKLTRPKEMDSVVIPNPEEDTDLELFE